jgi:hypothetical protein
MSCLSTEVRSSRKPTRTPRRAGKPVNRQHAQVTEQPASASLAAEQEVNWQTPHDAANDHETERAHTAKERAPYHNA